MIFDGSKNPWVFKDAHVAFRDFNLTDNDLEKIRKANTSLSDIDIKTGRLGKVP